MSEQLDCPVCNRYLRYIALLERESWGLVAEWGLPMPAQGRERMAYLEHEAGSTLLALNRHKKAGHQSVLFDVR